jgi:hypothetical protein
MLGNIKGGNNKFRTANVSSQYELQVATPQNEEDAGFVHLSTYMDSGTVTGSPEVRPPRITDDYRLSVGVDQSIFNATFVGDTGAFPYGHMQVASATTQTVQQQSGYLVVNASENTSNSTSTYVRSLRHFPTFATYPMYVDMWIRESNPTNLNCISEWGLLYLTNSATQTPLDGIFFRRISGGSLQFVVNTNGTEKVYSLDTTNVPGRGGTGSYSATDTNHYMVEYHHDNLCAWINDTMVKMVGSPKNQTTFTQSSNTPVGFRVFNAISGSITTARKIHVGSINVGLGDQQASKPWGHSLCGMGQGAYVTQIGHPLGVTQTANWNNSAAPSLGVGGNTFPMYTTLGGQWSETATQVNETDIPVFAYYNPGASATYSPKTLYVTGIRIGETVVTSNAVGVSATQFWWAAACGGSTANLAEIDSAGPPSTSAPRRMGLGCQSFLASAPLGRQAPGLFVDLSANPLVAPPGTYFQIIRKQQNGNTSSIPVWRGTVTVVGYHE